MLQLKSRPGYFTLAFNNRILLEHYEKNSCFNVKNIEVSTFKIIKKDNNNIKILFDNIGYLFAVEDDDIVLIYFEFFDSIKNNNVVLNLLSEPSINIFGISKNAKSLLNSSIYNYEFNSKEKYNSLTLFSKYISNQNYLIKPLIFEENGTIIGLYNTDYFSINTINDAVYKLSFKNSNFKLVITTNIYSKKFYQTYFNTDIYEQYLLENKFLANDLSFAIAHYPLLLKYVNNKLSFGIPDLNYSGILMRNYDILLRYIETISVIPNFYTQIADTTFNDWQYYSIKHPGSHWNFFTNINFLLQQYFDYYLNKNKQIINLLWQLYPNDFNCYKINNAFAVGDDIIYYAATTYGIKEQKNYIPQKGFKHLFYNIPVHKGWNIEKCPHGIPAIYVRENSIFFDLFVKINQKWQEWIIKND